jgi:hypothetical protein
VRLYSRPGNDLTRRFPLIVETLARLSSRSCIIDGEAVACDDNGVASCTSLCGKTGDVGHPDRLRVCRGPPRHRSRGELGPTGRQRHWTVERSLDNYGLYLAAFRLGTAMGVTR